VKRISTILVVVVALALGATTYAAVVHNHAASWKTTNRRAIGPASARRSIDG